MELLRFSAFLLFLVFGARVALAAADARRRRINQLLVFTLAASWAVGISQRDAWPFSHYALMRGIWSGDFVYHKLTLRALDAQGREWPTDPYSWSPVFPLVLQEWLRERYPRLSAAEQERAASFLFERAEAARARLARGEPIGSERLLGRWAAPDWWLYERAASVPPQPFTGLRVYSDSWRPRERVSDPSAVRRQLILEHRPR